MNKFLNLLLHKPNLILDAALWRVGKRIPDMMYLKMRFKLNMGYRLNFKNPQTFNEKLNWMKLNYHNPLFTEMADKYAAKQLVANRIGGVYCR